MADINKPAAAHSVAPEGAFGNTLSAVYSVTLAAAQVNDVVYFGKIARGATVIRVTLYNAALGGSTTLDIGYATAEIGGTLVADEDYWIDGKDTSSQAITEHTALATAAPKTLSEEAYITGTVKGAAATGAVSVVVQYIPA